MALMCGGGGGGELTEEEKKANAEVLKVSAENKTKEAKVIKMLLLGAGESGKSTIFKQMKVINKDGYSQKELKEFKTIVHGNVCQSMNSLLGAYEKLDVSMSGTVKGLVSAYEEQAKSEDVTPELGKIIDDMWKDDVMQGIFKRRNEFQLHDSAEFYFQNIERIASADYCPTTDDVLRSRVRTTGIVQSEFEIKSMAFAMFDVGGQRNERRKWIHCFDNVDAVVFVAALSEFDQLLFEDETKNRLDEALDLFQQIVNSKWFVNSSVILFLNKKDLFEKKLEEKVFADYVNKDAKRTPYEGANTMKECAEYTKQLFLAKNKNSSKSIYSHITTAIDTSNVKFVFNAVVAMILENNLKASGLA